MRNPLLASLFASTAVAQGVWLQATPAASPTARAAHAMALDPASQRVVLFGGASNTAFTVDNNDLWQWNGTDWTQLFPSGLAPSRRHYCGFCSEGAGGLLLFGGYEPAAFGGPQVRGDTWRLQAGAWALLQPGGGPAPRQRHGMVATPQGVLLFGGCSNLTGPLFGDTWLWNGATWTQLASPTSPPARFAHGMAFDASRGVVVVFGGTIGGLLTPLFGDTWEWNGTVWSQRTPAHAPAPRFDHEMTFSPATNRVVLFGGTVWGSIMNDAWTWDGTDWQQLTLAGPSPARTSSPIVFAPGNQGGVRFGGLWSNLLDDTWQVLTATAPSLTSFGTGCVGPNAMIPSLAAAPGAAPRIGTTMQFRVGNLPAGFSLPMLALGLSNTIAAGPPPYALPFDLGVLGWPGCQQLVSLDSMTANAAFGAFSDFPLAVPLQAALLGFVFHGQAIVFYLSNETAVSNGVTAVVGI